MKSFIEKHHPLLILLTYLVVVNLKSSQPIDFVIAPIILVYVLFKQYLDTKKQPDIRKEVEETLKQFKKEMNDRQSKVETEHNEIKSKVSVIASSKNIGMSGGTFKF